MAPALGAQRLCPLEALAALAVAACGRHPIQAIVLLSPGRRRPGSDPGRHHHGVLAGGSSIAGLFAEDHTWIWAVSTW